MKAQSLPTLISRASRCFQVLRRVGATHVGLVLDLVQLASKGVILTGPLGYGTFTFVFPTVRNLVYAQTTNVLNPVSNIVFAFAAVAAARCSFSRSKIRCS